MCGAGAITLFAAWAFTILMFFWSPIGAFFVAVIASIIGFYLCIRGVEAIEQKVAKDNAHDAFLPRIQKMKRIAILMMFVMVIGAFILAVFIQDSFNAGPAAIEALYNSTVDNVFEIGGAIGFGICSVGMFGTLFPVADVVDNFGKKSANLAPAAG